MIDEMGMKGERRGGAVVSPVHANFIVTEGEGALASDALALAEEIRERFRREHGVELEYEVELWGADGEFKDEGGRMKDEGRQMKAGGGKGDGETGRRGDVETERHVE
jgi:hypothetical protein